VSVIFPPLETLVSGSSTIPTPCHQGQEQPRSNKGSGQMEQHQAVLRLCWLFRGGEGITSALGSSWSVWDWWLRTCRDPVHVLWVSVSLLE